MRRIFCLAVTWGIGESYTLTPIVVIRHMLEGWERMGLLKGAKEMGCGTTWTRTMASHCLILDASNPFQPLSKVHGRLRKDMSPSRKSKANDLLLPRWYDDRDPQCTSPKKFSPADQ